VKREGKAKLRDRDKKNAFVFRTEEHLCLDGFGLGIVRRSSYNLFQSR
jgi:hypothetical protein